MLLLSAELRKLARPLLWGTAIAAVLFFGLLLWGATANASSSLASPRIDSACDGSSAPACVTMRDQAVAGANRQALEERRQELPGRVGEVAVGMMASMPGVFVVALLAGAAVGGEWSGRTIRTVLTHEGRRLRVLAAKWVALWLVMLGLTLVVWALLSILGPILAAAFHLPGAAGSPLFAGFSSSASQLARGAVVLAAFTLIGVMAGALTRNTLGAVATVVGVIVVCLIVGGVASTARLSPATAVQSWMGFRFTGGFLPTNFWSRFDQSGVTPSQAFGFVGLLVTMAVAWAVTAWRARADVTA
ncbi:MAG TPA: ABC transporter permease subunit [Actinomycetota bacterium]|nr:ABC transporter permease subunit [Actinomycetota bacterium]